MSEPIIRKFNVKNFKPYANIVVIGKKKTGKSTLIKWILYYKHKRLRMSYVVSETALMTGQFKGEIPDNLVHSKFDIPQLEQLLKQQKIIRTDKENNPRTEWKDKKTDCAIILDDILGLSKDWQKSEPIKSAVFNGRHFLVDFILGIQDVMGIPPAIRANLDYIIITKVTDAPSYKKLYDNYWNPAFGDKKIFDLVVKKCTEGYKNLLIDNASLNNTQNLQDCVYYIENPHPNLVPEHRLCSKGIWRFCNKYLESEDDKKKKSGIKL